MDDNETWCLVPKQPGMHVIGTKSVFKVKYCVDNTISRLKTRLVVKGKGGFSPFKPAMVRIVLALTVTSKWAVHQMDVKNVSLNGISQSPGFKNKKFPDHVCQLKKALYGLKQAPSARFDRFSFVYKRFSIKHF